MGLDTIANMEKRMKHTWRLTLIAVMLVVLAIPLVASAQSGGPYTSGFQLQNLDAGTATVTITYYSKNGAVAADVPDTISGNGSKTYFPLSAVASGFDGSVVVSSDKPLAAITNVLTTDHAGGASYSGATSGAPTVNLPLIMKGNFGYSTWFNVQNAGSSTANISIAYAGTACSETAAIAPGAAATFDQTTNACLPNGYVGAATITNAASNQPLVAAVMQIQSGSKSLLAYNGFADASTNPVMPLVSTNFYGSITGIQIQNTGGSATNVTVQYTPSAGFPGAACSETKNVAAGQSATFFLPMPAGCGTAGTGVTNPAGGFVGSARVSTNSASMPLVAIVNQINAGNSTSSAYSGINPASGTSQVSLPLIMDRNFGYFTGIAVANVGASTTTVNCTFTGTSYSVSASVPAGGSLTDVQLDKIANGYVGSGTCTATGGDAKIAAIVNELGGGPATDDRLLTYNGANY
jgi:hypothetical protein